MKISHDIRDASRAQNEVDAGMEAMSEKFRASGGEIYTEVG
jgi:hypothetical protein